MSNVKGMQLRFQPKGSMCAACRHKDRDCSNLNFFEMLPVLERIKDEEDVTVLVVKCSEFNRLYDVC